MENKRTLKAKENFYKNLKMNDFSLTEGSSFIDSRSYLILTCSKGHRFKINPNKLQQGRGCPHCSKRVKQTVEGFKKEVKNMTGNEYSVLGNYENTFVPIKIRHNKCGRTLEISRNNFLKGRRCKTCSLEQRGLNRRWTQEEFENKVNEVSNCEYSVQSDYIKSNEQVLIKHKTCNYEWMVYPNNFIYHGSRCPNCVHIKSKGEEIIKEYLDKFNIDYVFQAKFKDLKYKRTLAYDFYIPGRNLLIEYDGKQHFKPIKHFGGERAFKDLKTKDEIKNKYAESKNINLLRISYKENIHQVLNSTLQEASHEQKEKIIHNYSC